MNAQAKTVRVPISNILGGGDYTGIFELGTTGQQVNLLLDTGSSTPAINLSDFTGAVTPTNFYEHLAYGSLPQGFDGPVVETNLKIGTGAEAVNLQGVNVVVIPPKAGHPFGQADGILGLAYKALNGAFDLGTNSVAYFFQGEGQPNPSRQLYHLPTYFTQMEQAGLVPNKFSFYTLRSITHYGSSDPSSDPLNLGYFIAGGGEEATDLYSGDFTTVKVVDDRYYNTHVTNLYVGDLRIPVSTNFPVPPGYPPFLSNSIVDSGTNGISLPNSLYGQVVQAFGQHNQNFSYAIENSIVNDLSGWPNVAVELQGMEGVVRLTMTPDTYWQLNGPQGQSVFGIRIPPNSGPNQVILGLPLMNNYYTIFDRSVDSGQGVIKFASIVKP